MHLNQEIVELKYFDTKLGQGKFKSGEEHSVNFEIVLDAEKIQNPFMNQLKNYLHDSNSQHFITSCHLRRGLHLSNDNFIILISELESKLIDEQTILISGGSFSRFKPYGFQNRFYYFYETKHPFSQWYKCKFELNGCKFSSAEQFMMYSKANLFNDSESAKMILSTSNTRKQKEIGRKVKGFNKEKWNKKALEIVYEGNYEKFNQNEELKKVLLSTKGHMIVEASPYDKIWGIGLSEEDSQISNILNWQGTNWLGIVLTELRQEFLSNGTEDISYRPDCHNYWVNTELSKTLEKYEW